MKRKYLLTAVLWVAGICIASAADTLTVKSFRYAGPFEVTTPYEIDSVNIKGKKFETKELLDAHLSFDTLGNKFTGIDEVQSRFKNDNSSLNLLGFSIENKLFTKANINVKGLKHYKVFVDGKSAKGELKLEPGTHDIVIKTLILKDKEIDSLKVSVISEKEGRISFREDGKHIYSLDANTIGETCGGISISPSGKYFAVTYGVVNEDGDYSSYTEIRSSSSDKLLYRGKSRINWMPKSDKYWALRKGVDGNDLIATDPERGEESVIAHNVPKGSFRIAPSEDYLLYTMEQEGPKEGAVHQILTPDDRQPGWRDRSYLSKYDIATGLMQQLTYGYHNVWVSDISADGSKLLLMTTRERLTQRPTTLYTLFELDVKTLERKTLVSDDGFIRTASYSPDGKQLVITGSAEAFGGVGLSKTLKEGQIPNEFDVRLFTFDIASLKATPIGVEFGPSVDGAPVWAAFDGKIYFKTEDKDVQNLYRADPRNGKIERLANKEESLAGFDIANTSAMLVYSGQSLCNGHRAYLYNLKNGKQRVVADIDAVRFADTVMGEGGAYEFTSSRGDVINGFYVLPPDFDPSRKYPLLVHYYGGCSPSARYCVGSYSPQVYAAQGYVFYVVNPSGAAGFGQEFAARHVNTAGDVVAEDIIEATQNFCKDHPFVDSSKIGCFSASYGGFMTQLLLTKTDIFTTGISHAGISDHSSYWGEGYWGYSYSEVSMAGSYPWTRKDLYVDRSPLYNADKIHTPLLFLHGSADTNVPIGESIQMFTALKLLGEDTAFVVVDGENHGIREFGKRRQWLRTIFAWFAKYLQDDPTWWDELYPQHNL